MNVLSLLQAVFLSFSGENLHQRTANLKRSLFAGLSGTVVEIGAGSGDNPMILPASISRYVGVEPNKFLRGNFSGLEKLFPFEAKIIDGLAESLPFPDEFADAVICTFVLCSVRDQHKAITEVMRVLKPGGKFIFLEHIGAPEHTFARRVQKLCSPLSVCLCGGCRWDRDTGMLIHNAPFHTTRITFSPPFRRFLFSQTLINGQCVK